VRRTGFPAARVFAVGALALAVGTLLWVLSGIGGSTRSSSATSSAVSSHPSSSQPSSSGTTGKAKAPIDWKTIRVAVINGYSPTGTSAADVQAQLKSAGWLIAGIGETSSFGNPATYVTYPPGKLEAAKVVAQRLHLGAPVPLSQAAGVNPAVKNVAVVLGPDLLPTAGA
jgi:LytR cell envelope-related transcriptional attenuator